MASCSAHGSKIFRCVCEFAAFRVHLDVNVAIVMLPRFCVCGTGAQARRHLVSVKRQCVHVPAVTAGFGADLIATIILQVNSVRVCRFLINRSYSFRLPLVSTARERSHVHWSCVVVACSCRDIGIHIPVISTPCSRIVCKCTRRRRLGGSLCNPINTPISRIGIPGAHSTRLPTPSLPHEAIKKRSQIARKRARRLTSAISPKR